MENIQPESSTAAPKPTKRRLPKWAYGIAGIATVGILAMACLFTDCSSGQKTVDTEKKTKQPRLSGALTDSINGHQWVDLGLPSGLRWATCNVGANSPEEAGNYYAWGETEPKEEYSTINSITYKVPFKKLQEAGIIDETGTLTPAHDVATVLWGDEWRMPTIDEYLELISSCDWEFTSLNGTNGYLVTGPNHQSIFLPAAAFQQNTTIENLGDFGDYWSASIVDELTGVAHSLGYSSKSFGRRRYARYAGRTIRPVTD